MEPHKITYNQIPIQVTRKALEAGLGRSLPSCNQFIIIADCNSITHVFNQDFDDYAGFYWCFNGYEVNDEVITHNAGLHGYHECYVYEVIRG